MAIDTMSQFAADILYPLAASADQNENFPTELWQYIEELGLNFYALPEALGGVAAEKNILSNVLIAEHLAKGDFSLAAGMLSTFSVINAITQWGAEQVQALYLNSFAQDSSIRASFLQFKKLRLLLILTS